LRKIIGKGIAYHHSGLIPKIREVVEFLIKNKLIKWVFATETFAVGLNFPVKTVVMTGLTKPSESGIRDLLVSEYKQMAGRAGRRFIDTVGNVIFWFYPNSKTVKKVPYPTWATINSITNGKVNSVESKYNIDPNYIIKTINSNSSRLFTDNSFKYYNSDKNIILKEVINIPDKFLDLYAIECKIKEYNEMGLSYIDKNYNKMLQKLSASDKTEYKQFIESASNVLEKSEYEKFIDEEQSIIDFLANNEFITYNDANNKYTLTTKGKLANMFNEINPVLFVNEMEYILKDQEMIIPILSMFIDDGILFNEMVYDDKDIIYF
jgi:superfamily II RNA helicase